MAVSPAARPARRGWWPGGAAWALWTLAMLGVATIPWFDHLLRQAHRPELTQLHPSTIPSVLAALVAVTVGAVPAGAGHTIRWAGCCWRWDCR